MKEMKEITESQAAFARRLNVNRSTISRAVADGRVLLNDRGLVRVEASLKALQAAQGTRPDLSEQHAATRAAKAAKGIEQGVGSQEGNTGPSRGAKSRTKAKAEALTYENALIRLEMQLRRHQCYPRVNLKHEAVGLGATLRAAVERLIDQTAPRLAAMDDPASRVALIQAECRSLHRMLRQEFPRVLRRLRKGAA